MLIILYGEGAIRKFPSNRYRVTVNGGFSTPLTNKTNYRQQILQPLTVTEGDTGSGNTTTATSVYNRWRICKQTANSNDSNR